MTGADRTLLVTVTGHDRPGVTAGLFRALSADDGSVVVSDVEQVVVRGRLVLGVLVSAAPGDPAGATVLPRLRAELAPLGMQVDVVPGGPEAPAGRGAVQGRTHVTVLGHPLRPAAMAALATAVADAGGNIERIARVAAYPVTAVDLEVSGPAADVLRPALAVVAAQRGVDVAVEPAGLHRRASRLVVMDVDSTLVQDEVIDLLAERAGTAREVAAVTERAMSGELDFAASLRERVRMLEGLPVAVLAEVRAALRLTPGARTLVRTLQLLDHRVALVSGGFHQVVDPLAASLGITAVAANTLEVDGDRLTGGLVGPVVDRAGKAAALERFAAEAGVPLGRTVAIGDGANDLDMLARAGMGVAFNAKPVLREAADTAVSVPFLDSILFLLGIPREEVEAATAP